MPPPAVAASGDDGVDALDHPASNENHKIHCDDEQERDPNADGKSSKNFCSSPPKAFKQKDHRLRIFLCFSFYYAIGGSFDLGCITATLPNILTDLHVGDFAEVGFLGSVGYYGMFLTMPFFGILFSKIHERQTSPASSPALAEWSGNEEVPHNTLTTDTSDNCSATDGAQHHEQLSLFESISLLLCNYNYAIPVLNLSVVFLVAQGVQFWAPEYLLLVFSPVSETTITVTTLLVLLTGPATGILAGGKLVDHFGGYHGLNQRITTYKILLTMGSVSVFAGFGANVLSGEPEYGKACFLLWVVLAVGAGSVGPLQGISISAIPVKSLRTFGNSLATVAFMVGASIGPLLPGFGLEEFCREGVVSVVCAQEAVAPLLTLGCAFVVGNTALCLWWETRRVRDYEQFVKKRESRFQNLKDNTPNYHHLQITANKMVRRSGPLGFLAAVAAFSGLSSNIAGTVAMRAGLAKGKAKAKGKAAAAKPAGKGKAAAAKPPGKAQPPPVFTAEDEQRWRMVKVAVRQRRKYEEMIATTRLSPFADAPLDRDNDASIEQQRVWMAELLQAAHRFADEVKRRNARRVETGGDIDTKDGAELSDMMSDALMELTLGSMPDEMLRKLPTTGQREADEIRRDFARTLQEALGLMDKARKTRPNIPGDQASAAGSCSRGPYHEMKNRGLLSERTAEGPRRTPNAPGERSQAWQDEAERRLLFTGLTPVFADKIVRGLYLGSLTELDQRALPQIRANDPGAGEFEGPAAVNFVVAAANLMDHAPLTSDAQRAAYVARHQQPNPTTRPRELAAEVQTLLDREQQRVVQAGDPATRRAQALFRLWNAGDARSGYHGLPQLDVSTRPDLSNAFEQDEYDLMRRTGLFQFPMNYGSSMGRAALPDVGSENLRRERLERGRPRNYSNLLRAVRAIQLVRANGGRVFVGCHQGKDRSGTTIIGYLMVEYGVNFPQAVAYAQAKRFILGGVADAGDLGALYRPALREMLEDAGLGDLARTVPY
eukprot:g2293.t1